MMKIFVLISFAMATCLASAQDSWKVVFNGKTLFTATGENEEKNIARISRQSAQQGTLQLAYKQAIHEKDWERIMNVYTTDDEELFESKGNLLRISPDLLKEWADKYAEVKIYSWYVPTDPELKMMVRVRRVHLCTIRFV